MSGRFELPDASPELKEIEEQERQQHLKPLRIGLAAVIVLGIAGGLAFYLLGSSDPTPTPTSVAVASPEPTTLPVVATTPSPEEPSPTPEPVDPPAATPEPVEPSPTPDDGQASGDTVAVSDTPAPTPEPDTPTPTPAAPTPNLPPPSSEGRNPEAALHPATLPGKLAVPVFNLAENTYYLYILNGPAWQFPEEPFQKAASQPVFSPDGSQLLFRSWGGGLTGYGERLVSRDLAGGEGRLISTELDDARPDWAEAEMPVVFHFRPSGQSAQVVLQGLWAGAPQDANSRKPIAVGENPTWLPDGRIVYASGQPQGEGLYVVDTGGAPQKISARKVSPVGSPVAAVVAFSDGNELYRLSIDTGQETRLTQTPERELLPTWSPSGQYLAFVREEAGGWGLYVMEAEGGEALRLADIPGAMEGRPSNIPQEKFIGWTEEQLAWGK